MTSNEDGGRLTLAVFFSCLLSIAVLGSPPCAARHRAASVDVEGTATAMIATGVAPEFVQSQSSTDKEEAFEKVDPYTRGDAAALDKAGYVSFGPFLLAEGIKTQDVEEALGGESILWVETAHFKLGSSLRTYRPKGDPREDKALEDELKRLAKKFTVFHANKNKLDPWLRLHLYAQRLEDAYADFARRFGLDEGDFTARPGTPAKPPLGSGPYLGAPLKFTVLLTEKQSGTARFVKQFLGVETPSWQRWQLPGGSMFLGMSAEIIRETTYETDSALYATVLSELVQNFVDGIRGYDLSTPLWFKVGLAHVYSRSVDERFALSAKGTYRDKEDQASWNWEPRVYGLVFNKVASTWKDMSAWSRWDAIKTQGHLVAWSRVAWLLERKNTNLRALLLGLTEPIGDVADEARAKRAEELVEAAFQAGLGKSTADAELEWRRWVLRTYEKK